MCSNRSGRPQHELCNASDFAGSVDHLRCSASAHAALPQVSLLVLKHRCVAVLNPSLLPLLFSANRFRRIENPITLAGFERLTTLQLNDTLMSWSEVSPSVCAETSLKLC